MKREESTATDGVPAHSGSPAAPFLFIVGSPRSGTTLLQAILDSHSEIAAPPESHFVLPLARRRRRYERQQGFDVEAFLDDLRDPWLTRWLAGWRLSEDDFRRRLVESDVGSYREAVRAMFALYAERQGKPRFVDKTPNYVLDLGCLASVFPEARFLHLVRDGRDVALSLRAQDWGPNSIVYSAWFWSERVESGRAAGRALGPERYLEVHYEDVVRDTEGAVREICRFASIDFEPAMLGYAERADEVIGSAPYPASHQRLLLPPTAGLREWRSQMSPVERRLFEALAGRSLVRFGYPVEASPWRPLGLATLLARARQGLPAFDWRTFP
jgi:hypothetical protein